MLCSRRELWWWTAFLATAPIWVGCERSDTARDDSQPEPVSAVESEAPREWSEFEAWVTREIQEIRAAVPLPENPILARPKWPCRPLASELGRARHTSSWESSAGSDKPLTVLGPFRSDQPAATFRADKVFDRKLGWGLQMGVSEFEVDSTDVGRIELEILAPFGKHVDLRWSEGGFARLPIPDNEKPRTFVLYTEGLTNWSGTIDTIMIRSDGYEEGRVFEIRSLRFLGYENEYPRSIGLRRISVGGQRRTAVYGHCPAEIVFSGSVLPDDAKMTVGLAARAPDRNRYKPGAATFQIIVEDGGERTAVFNRTLNPVGQWTDISVSLASWAGKDVNIILMASADNTETVALWANPTVYQPVAEPPIMILYLIDTLAAKHCSLYGYHRPTTPRLEALAKGGVWFADMYANSPVTVTSVPDTQLSMPTERHGVYHASIGAPLELVTIADALSAAGFATASFITNANAGVRQNMDQGFDEFSPRTLFHWQEKSSLDRSVPIESVMAWFERHHDRPAFVYIHTCEPHAPYTPPVGYAGRFDPDYRGSIDGTMNEDTGYFAAELPRDIEHVKALYDEECLYADARMGEFLDRVAAAGFIDRVNIFVIADHGEELQEHGHWGHGLGLYDEVLRVPWVAAGPLVTTRGRQEYQANLYDVMPTILDLFNIPQPYELFGTSLRILMQNDADDGPAELTGYRTTFTSHHRYRGRQQVEYAVVEAKKWKLHYRYMHDDKPAYPKPARFELYDLEHDPEEKNDLLAERPEIARRLMCKLVAYTREQHPYDTRSSDEGLKFDASHLQDLQSLGYIERN